MLHTSAQIKTNALLVRTRYLTCFIIKCVILTTKAYNNYYMKLRHFMHSHPIQIWIRVSQSQFVPCSHPSLIQQREINADILPTPHHLVFS